MSFGVRNAESPPIGSARSLTSQLLRMAAEGMVSVGLVRIDVRAHVVAYHDFLERERGGAGAHAAAREPGAERGGLDAEQHLVAELRRPAHALRCLEICQAARAARVDVHDHGRHRRGSGATGEQRQDECGEQSRWHARMFRSCRAARQGRER